MKQLVFATHNPHKLDDVRRMLAGRYEVLGLNDIGCTEEIAETAATFEGNALLKAQHVKEHYGMDCFSEDTGLEVDALHGAPGVHTARYAGAPRSAERNMNLLLKNLENCPLRTARFRTAMALILGDETHLFHGVVEGTILQAKTGEDGFGYDPIFRPDGYDTSFAQMTQEAKAEISHRGRALRKLIAFLEARATTPPAPPAK